MRISKLVLLLASVCSLFACTESNENELRDDSSVEKVKIAVVLPKGQTGNSWDNVLGWVKDNI